MKTLIAIALLALASMSANAVTIGAPSVSDPPRITIHPAPAHGVPGPIVGAGIPGALAALAAWRLWRRKRA